MIQLHSKAAERFENLIHKYTVHCGDAAIQGNQFTQQELLTYCVRCVVESDTLEQALNFILKKLAVYFDARIGFICSFSTADTVTYAADLCGMDPPFGGWPDCRDWWEDLLEMNQLVLIRSADELAEYDPVNFGLLREWGMDSLCLAPVFDADRLTGIIGLANLRRNWNGMVFLPVVEACVAASIQKRMTQKEKIRVQYVDSLTGCLNFEGYKLRVERLFRENPDKNYAMRYYDIKRFKFINEVHGYDTGDRILRCWSNYLSGHVREGETFCRVSGDTMSALLYYEDIGELDKRFEEMVRYLTDIPELAGKKLHVELFCGTYLITRDDRELTVAEMLNRANMAQKSVKDQPGSHVAFYTDTMRQKEINEMFFIRNMKDALRKEEFLLYFQPQIPISPDADHRIRAEVLVRWKADGRLVAMPGQFIHLFERIGFIVDLDRYMFEHACQYIRDVEKRYGRQLNLCVNVSRVTMLRPDFADIYCRIKDKYSIPNNLVELEFTENVAVTDISYFSKLIVKLKEMGFSCAMDDFGSGQSSLNVLQALPLDILKLDQVFFRDKRNEQRKRIVVSSVLAMAKQLNMMTVAEGIESAWQAEELAEMGCDYIQGYYYSQPLPSGEFEEKYLKHFPEG